MTDSQRKAARGAGGGVARSGVGAFVIAVGVEVGLVPPDVGPNTLILLTWVAGQVCYTALSPRQWASLLGGSRQ